MRPWPTTKPAGLHCGSEHARAAQRNNQNREDVSRQASKPGLIGDPARTTRHQQLAVVIAENLDQPHRRKGTHHKPLGKAKALTERIREPCGID
jgi:hypothetical protein